MKGVQRRKGPARGPGCSVQESRTQCAWFERSGPRTSGGGRRPPPALSRRAHLDGGDQVLTRKPLTIYVFTLGLTKSSLP